MANEILRNYNMEDELLETRAQVKHDLLAGGELANFTAKFPAIDATWLTSFATDIATAKNFPADNSVILNIRVLTEDVNASCAEGFVALDRLDLYAKIAFPTSPAKQRVFGQDSWQSARGDQEKTRRALLTAFGFADNATYKTPLTAAGMLAADITVLNTIAGNIDLKNGLQESALAGRPVTTEERIQVHNVVFAKMGLLKIMSEEVYRGDPAKINWFNLYPPATPPSTTVTIKVVQGGVERVGATVTISSPPLAPQDTNDGGKVTFTSVAFNDSLDFTVNDPTLGLLTITGKAILLGEVNDLEVAYP